MQVLDILHKIGYTEISELGKSYRACPLYRPSDNKTSLSIDKSTGMWYDFADRNGGSLLSLVKLTMNLPSLEAAKTFIGDATIEIGEAVAHRYELSDTKKFDKQLLLKLEKKHTYWENRGISLPTIMNFEGGIARNGRMKNRYVFPVFDEKDYLVGFSGRSLVDNPDFPRWKHLGAKSTWTYPLRWNKEILFYKKEVILLESLGDMLKLWDVGIKNTLVTFGVAISKSIIELLLRIDARKILIAFNNDVGNNLIGNDAADEGRLDLLKYFDEQQVITAIPDFKDFGEMNREQIDLWKTKFLT